MLCHSVLCTLYFHMRGDGALKEELVENETLKTEASGKFTLKLFGFQNLNLAGIFKWDDMQGIMKGICIVQIQLEGFSFRLISGFKTSLIGVFSSVISMKPLNSYGWAFLKLRLGLTRCVRVFAGLSG